MDSHPARRDVLAAAGGSVATLVSLGVTTSRTSASSDWEHGLTPSITRTDDPDELAVYQPKFQISKPARDQLEGLYGWKAESDEWETDVYYYWMKYTHQDPALDGYLERAVGIFASDSHLWDHEPAIVFVDSETGEPERAVVTGFHHYAREIPRDAGQWSASETDDPTHVNLRVVDPWHHYQEDVNRPTARVDAFAEFGSFLEQRESWERDGFYENSHRPAIDDPWVMSVGGRSTWWADGTRDARAAKLWEWMGLRDAGSASGTRLE